MKKVMIVMILVAFAEISLMGYTPSKATFSTHDGRSMRVFIDGKLINKYPRRFVSVANLRPGKHRVVLEVYNRRGKKIKARDRIVLRPGLETRFSVDLKGSNKLAIHRVGSGELDRHHRKYPRSRRHDSDHRYADSAYRTACPVDSRHHH